MATDFNSKDYEIIIITAHFCMTMTLTKYTLIWKTTETQQPKGPKVQRTINEIYKTRIHDACFTMNKLEFEDYFRDYKSTLLPPIEFATTSSRICQS